MSSDCQPKVEYRDNGGRVLRKGLARRYRQTNGLHGRASITVVSNKNIERANKVQVVEVKLFLISVKRWK